MTDVDTIIRSDHCFLPLQLPLQYTFLEFEYIINESLIEIYIKKIEKIILNKY